MKSNNVKTKITAGVLAALTLVSISSAAIVPTYAASSTTSKENSSKKGIIDKYFSESSLKGYGKKALNYFIDKGVAAIPGVGPFLSTFSSDFTNVIADLFGLSNEDAPDPTEEAKKEIISEIKKAVDELNSSVNVRAHDIDRELFKLTALSQFEDTLDSVSSNSQLSFKEICSLSATKNSREKLEAIADTTNEDDIKQINRLAYYLTGKSISELSKYSKYEGTTCGTFSSYLDYQIQKKSYGKQIITNTMTYMNACTSKIAEAIYAAKLSYYAKYQIALENANNDKTRPSVVKIQSIIDALDDITNDVLREYKSVYNKMDTSLFTATVDDVPYVYQAEAWAAANNNAMEKHSDFRLLQNWNGENKSLDKHHSDATNVSKYFENGGLHASNTKYTINVDLDGHSITDGNTFTFNKADITFENTNEDAKSNINEQINTDDGNFGISNIDINNKINGNNSNISMDNVNMTYGGCYLDNGSLDANKVTIKNSINGFILNTCNKVSINNCNISNIANIGINTALGANDLMCNKTMVMMSNFVNYVNKAENQNNVQINNTKVNYCGSFGIKTGNATMCKVNVEHCNDSGIFCFYSKIIDSNISCNKSETRGGGICAPIGVSIYKSTIYNNHSVKSGGGIYAFNDLTIKDSVINNNSSKEDGGAVHSFYQANISNTHLCKNTANDCGGAIYAGTLIANNIYVEENNACYGGGIYVTNSNTNIDDAQIKNNNASKQGGGLWCESNSLDNYTMTKITVTGNTANDCGGGMYMNCGSVGAADIVLGDKVIITDNTSSNRKSNLFLETTTCKKSIINFSSSRPITNNSSIGISSGTSQSSIDITSKHSNEISHVLTSDNNSYSIEYYHGFWGGYYAKLTK